MFRFRSESVELHHTNNNNFLPLQKGGKRTEQFSNELIEGEEEVGFTKVM